MDNQTQAEKLYNYLKRNPKGAPINDLRQELWIMNIMEAKRQANLKWVEKGELIETFEIRRTSNGRPVNGYRLKPVVSLPRDNGKEVTVPATGTVEMKLDIRPPSRSRVYE